MATITGREEEDPLLQLSLQISQSWAVGALLPESKLVSALCTRLVAVEDAARKQPRPRITSSNRLGTNRGCP